MSKFKKFIITYLVPITTNVMIDYVPDELLVKHLESKGFCVCKKEECKSKCVKKGAK